MRRRIAFSGLAAALALCGWRGLSQVSAGGGAHSMIDGLALAAGVFTLAIAVVIRD